MKDIITTKDLMALNEMMTFENWIALKMNFCSSAVSDKALTTMFKNMSKEHFENHNKLLNYLQSKSNEGGKK